MVRYSKVDWANWAEVAEALDRAQSDAVYAKVFYRAVMYLVEHHRLDTVDLGYNRQEQWLVFDGLGDDAAIEVNLRHRFAPIRLVLRAHESPTFELLPHTLVCFGTLNYWRPYGMYRTDQYAVCGTVVLESPPKKRGLPRGYYLLCLYPHRDASKERIDGRRSLRDYMRERLLQMYRQVRLL
jgi:hypothetical protein